MTDKIEVQCPNCGTKQHVDRDYENRRGRCSCGEVFVMIAAKPKARKKPNVVNQVFVQVPSSSSANSAADSQGGKYCHACGAGIHSLAEICPNCGVRQPSIRGRDESKSVSESEKQLLPAFLLWLFLGYLGAHAFYAGRIKTGVIYLTCFLSGFILVFPWAVNFVLFIVDFIYLVTGRYKDSHGHKITQWLA